MRSIDVATVIHVDNGNCLCAVIEFEYDSVLTPPSGKHSSQFLA